MEDYLQELSSTSTEADSLLPNNESQLIQPASASLPPTPKTEYNIASSTRMQ